MSFHAASSPANPDALYLPAGSPLVDRVRIVEGAMPVRDQAEGIETVFVLSPSPLDLSLASGGWPANVRIVLVSPKGAASCGSGTPSVSPLRELLHLPTETLEAALAWLQAQPSGVAFLSFDRRPWYAGLIPQDLRDRYRIAGRKCDGYLYAYHPHQRAWLFDDGYRRKDLGVLTLAQSSAYFLRVLEELAYTPDGPVKKRMLFERVFPFYRSGLSPDAKVAFTWDCDASGLELDEVRLTAVGQELPQHATEYALAVCALSEIAACFTHSGYGELYGRLLGDLVAPQGERILVAPSLTEGQRQRLRHEQPDLYLHLFYRVPNQCLVAAFDTLGAPDPGLIACAEALLVGLRDEEDLRLTKRAHEITALAGTLCQLHTYAARHSGERVPLTLARERGRLALERARPFEYGRDLNYWISAVLTDWTLFPAQVRGEPGLAADRETVMEGVRRHLDEAPEDGYNLMLCFLAAAVEEAILGTAGVRTLLAAREMTPARLAERLAAADFDPRRAANYALCLAVGYAALDTGGGTAADEGYEAAIATARRFFFEVHARVPGRQGAILNTVALKLAVCDLFRLQAQGAHPTAAARAAEYLGHAQGLAPSRAPTCVLALLERAARESRPMSRAEVLQAVFSLPY